MNETDLLALHSRRARAALAVRVSFEESRLAATCLATAYEQILPQRGRCVTSAAPPSAAQDHAQLRSAERTGT